jgi:AraC family transcriptional regulator of adaptative response / DNA-3-methyladenine glycosylase II
VAPFQGIVTTGIYCRVGCPATPKDENVRPFRFPAAAEAGGFRPCLRCRPDTVAAPSSWVAPSELVCRGLRLIADGALDGTTEQDLAVRLGVSERHLRRLFEEHVGATPDGVARSRRAHFARRLLIETDLPAAEIAFASGFGSVRQFNRAVQEVFRFTPTQLRARRRRGDRLVASAGVDLRLPYKAPLDWDAMTAFLAGRAIPGVEAVDADSYRRTIIADGVAGAIELRHVPNASHLVLRVHLPSVDGLIHIVDQARRIFDLDADPALIGRRLRRDAELRLLVQARPGLRVPGAWDPFELSVRAILGQQVSVKGATTLAGRLVEQLGDEVADVEQLGLSRLFPDAATVADADLGGVGLTRERVTSIKAFAAAVADGKVVLDGSQGLERVIDSLCQLRGIGAWTAHYIAMRAGGERDAFPAADLGLRKAFGGDIVMSPVGLEQRSQAWRPWRAYAAMHLWAATSSG